MGYPLEYAQAAQFWHLLYGVYLLWLVGLSGAFLLITGRDPMGTLGQLQTGWLGRTLILWMTLSLLTAGFFWPMLVFGPIVIVNCGAPLAAGIFAGGYALFVAFTSGKLLAGGVRVAV